MATQKENPDSWKARGLIKRDFQHSHDGPEEIPHRSNKSDKKQWCRRKEGRVHDFSEKVETQYGPKMKRVYHVCVACGKHKEWWGVTYRLVESTIWTPNGPMTTETWIRSGW